MPNRFMQKPQKIRLVAMSLSKRKASISLMSGSKRRSLHRCEKKSLFIYWRSCLIRRRKISFVEKMLFEEDERCLNVEDVLYLKRKVL
jgi:hypothetical protein